MQKVQLKEWSSCRNQMCLCSLINTEIVLAVLLQLLSASSRRKQRGYKRHLFAQVTDIFLRCLPYYLTTY